MLTYHNRYIPSVNLTCFVVESMGIFISVLLAYLLLSSRLEHNIWELEGILYRGLAITIFAQFCLYLLDLYDLNIPFTKSEILLSVLLTTGFFYFAVGIFIFLVRDFYIERNIFYLAGLFLFLFLAAWRLAFQHYINQYPPVFNILIIGAGERAATIAKLVENSRRLGFNLVGTWHNRSREEAGENSLTTDDSGIEDLRRAVRDGNVHKIIVAQEERRGNLPIRELLDCKINGIDVIGWPAFFEYLEGKIPVKNLPPSYFVFNGGFQVPYLSKKVSDFFSFAFSLVSVVLLIPVFLVVSAMIKLDSEGPVLYVQKRVGENGKEYRLFKFRTMIRNAEGEGGAVWATDEDPRITRVGKILRKYRIDELPQFFNVLRGEMNLVGPRPERPEFVRILGQEIPYYSIRHSIKPGITGWAQVKGSYSGTVEESRDKMEYDLFYLKNKSFKLDLYILFKTLKTLLLARGSR